MEKLSTFNYSQVRSVVTEFCNKVSKEEREKIMAALYVAEDIHRDQFRPEGPYINHVLRVAARLILAGITMPNIIIAALLHDGPEDQAKKILEFFSYQAVGDEKNAAINVLETKFGSSVADILRLVTNPEFPSDDKEINNIFYIEHVKEIVYRSPQAGVIKLSDFYDNGMSLRSVSDINRRTYLAKKYAPLFGVFTGALPEIAEFFSFTKETTQTIKDDLEKEFSFVKQHF